MKQQIISNHVLGEYFKRNLKVLWFSEVSPLQKHNINTPLKTTEAAKAVPHAFHLQQ